MTDFIASSAPLSNRSNLPGQRLDAYPCEEASGNHPDPGHIKATVTVVCSSYSLILSLAFTAYPHTHTLLYLFSLNQRSLSINVVNRLELTVNTQRPSARVTQVLQNPFFTPKNPTFTLKWEVAQTPPKVLKFKRI